MSLLKYANIICINASPSWEFTLNWSDLQILLVFHREGTLQKAATKLKVDISTVSRRIRALETDLEQKLIENISGRLVLTSFGEQVVQAADAMASESDRLQRIIKGKENNLSGVLRVALLDMLVFFHQDIFQSFSVAYPRITLELISGTSRLHSLTQREADIAIRVSKKPDDTLVGMRVLQTEYAIYAHSEIAESSFKSWATLPWIGWDPTVNARMNDAWMKKHVPSEQIRFRANSAISQFIMTESGGGACILPSIYGDLSNKLVRLSDDLKGFDTSVWVLTHRDLRRNGRVQTFLDHVYKGFKAFENNKKPK